MERATGFTFQVQGPNHRLEDRLLLDCAQGVAAVADGVTRFRYESSTSDQESLRVGDVADSFCSLARETLSIRPLPLREEAIRRVAHEVIQAISEFNRSHGYQLPDAFSSSDPYAAVGACAAIGSGDVVHYGYLGDVSVAYFDGVRLRTISSDQLVPTRAALAERRFADREERWSYLRAHLRNHTTAYDSQGRPCGYGVFDGNPAAGEFWSCGTIAVEPQGLVVLASDGAQPLLATERFSQILRDFSQEDDPQAAERACRTIDIAFDDDATLAVLRPQEA